MSASLYCLDSSIISKIFGKKIIQSVLTAEKLFNFLFEMENQTFTTTDALSDVQPITIEPSLVQSIGK